MQSLPKVNVYLRKSNLTLQVEIDGKNCTEIDLEECTDSANILDWLYHLKQKHYCTPELLYQVMEAFDAAATEILGDSIQGKFCPFGHSKQIDWTNPSS